MVNVGPVTTSTGCSSLNTSQELLSTVLRQLSSLNSNTQFLEECYFEYTSNDITSPERAMGYFGGPCPLQITCTGVVYVQTKG